MVNNLLKNCASITRQWKTGEAAAIFDLYHPNVGIKLALAGYEFTQFIPAHGVWELLAEDAVTSFIMR